MFLPIEPEPIKTWQYVLIRIGIPVGILLLVIFAFYPTINHEIQCLYHSNATGVGVCN